MLSLSSKLEEQPPGGVNENFGLASLAAKRLAYTVFGFEAVGSRNLVF